MPILLDTLEARLQAHAERLDLNEAQQERARSLAVAGVVGVLLGITPAELFSTLSPAFHEWERRTQAAVTIESEVQR